MDRRAGFFLVAALACLAMVPIAQQQFRATALVVAGVYVVLAVLSFLDSQARRRR